MARSTKPKDDALPENAVSYATRVEVSGAKVEQAAASRDTDYETAMAAGRRIMQKREAVLLELAK